MNLSLIAFQPLAYAAGAAGAPLYAGTLAVDGGFPAPSTYGVKSLSDILAGLIGGDRQRLKAALVALALGLSALNGEARAATLDQAREITLYKEGDIDWQDGQDLKSFDLRRDFPVLRYVLRVKGRLAVSGGTTDGTIQADSLRNVLSRIRLEGTRQGKSLLIKDYSGALCFRAAQFFHGTTPEYSVGGYGDSGEQEVVGNYDFSIEYDLDFQAPAFQDPFGDATILDAYRFSQLRLRLTTSDPGDFVSGGDRDHAFFASGGGTGVPTIELAAEVASDVDTDVSVFSLYTEIFKTVDVSSDARDLTQGADFDPGGFISRVLLRAVSLEASSGLLTLDDTVINRIRLEGAQQTFWENTWAAAQQKMKTQLGIETVPAGYNLMHFMPEGDPTTALDTRPLAARNVKLQNHVDSNGAGNGAGDSATLEFLQQRILPVG